jgi:hypothetical protein
LLRQAALELHPSAAEESVAPSAASGALPTLHTRRALRRR